MANSLLTINMITREAVLLWRNTNAFVRNIDTQYDDQFARTGAKIGASLRIRLPNDFTVAQGPAAQVQDTSEQSTTLVMANQYHVDVAFSSVDRSLSLDDFSRRILAPMVNNLAGAVAVAVMNGVEGGASNFVSNVDSSGNVITPTAATWLRAGAILDIRSAPKGSRKIVMNPITKSNTVASLAGLFNPQQKISDQYDDGEMSEALGFEWFSDQTVINHTTAAYSGTLQVSGANQTGLAITVGAITGGFALGDIISFVGVNAVNRITKADTGQLMQFVVTAAVASGGTSVSIYPALIPPIVVNGVSTPVQYQTVTASPANNAVITVATNASAQYIKNIAFAPEAVTMVTADLELPKGVHEAAREEYDGISMRMISAYDVRSDEFITRLDVLFGFLWVRPEWAVAVADSNS